MSGVRPVQENVKIALKAKPKESISKAVIMIGGPYHTAFSPHNMKKLGQR